MDPTRTLLGRRCSRDGIARRCPVGLDLGPDDRNRGNGANDDQPADQAPLQCLSSALIEQKFSHQLHNVLQKKSTPHQSTYTWVAAASGESVAPLRAPMPLPPKP